ncbi:MAG: hypothetical protein ABIF88_02835 [archaeon]
MKWKIPPKIKIYEALGCLADNRIKEEKNEIRIYSSSLNKFYIIKYSESENAIMTNDNGSYWKGYLGYPGITYLMKIGKIKYAEKFSQALKGIKWKDINQKFKNDFDKTIEYLHKSLVLQGINLKEFGEEIDNILKQIELLNLNLLGNKILPPKGY